MSQAPSSGPDPGQEAVGDFEDPSNIKGSGSGLSFTNETYARLATEPASFRGAAVDVQGQVFGQPEVYDNPRQTAFQMFADPPFGVL